MIYKNHIRYDLCVCELHPASVFMIKTKTTHKLCPLDYMCDHEKEVKTTIATTVMGTLGVEILFSTVY